MKQTYRLLSTIFKYIFIKLFNKFFFFKNIKVIPSLEDLNLFKIQYSKETRRYLFKNQNNRIGKIILDTSLINTELCLLGKKIFQITQVVNHYMQLQKKLGTKR